MHLTPETREAIKTEVQTFGTSMNLSDEQKARLKTALEGARERIEEYKKAHPDVSRADIATKAKEARPQIRERLTAFLTPEQLKTWDAEVAKAKSFLGYTS